MRSRPIHARTQSILSVSAASLLKLRPLRTGFALFSLAAALNSIPTVRADTVALNLTGTTQTDLWNAGSLTYIPNPGFPNFPGTGAWPNPIQSAVGDDAYLYKISNGFGGAGGPYPATEGIYFGGASSTVNLNGGSLGIVDLTPVNGIKTVAFQIQIGQAFGYDLLNNDLSLVTLKYTTADGTGTLASQSNAGLIQRYYNGAVPMPTGPNGEIQPEDIYVNLWGMQWDLSSIAAPILSYEIQFTGVQHASLSQLQVNQTSTAYGSTSVFPTESVWTAAGGNANWTTTGNWQGGALPLSGRTVRLTGSGVTLDASQSIGTLVLNAANGFTLNSSGGAVLSTQFGINTSAATAANTTINAPLHMTAYNLLDVDKNTTLTINGPITGAAFYKQGPGNLILTGNNTYDTTNTTFRDNGLMFRGGTNIISGTNTLTGPNNPAFSVRQDTTVILKGGDDRLDAKFIGTLSTATSRLVLGDAGVRSNQTFAGLNGIDGAQIVNGGGAATSTLTINNSATGPDSTYLGRLGGNGAGENNLALVKTGSGTLTLGIRNTHNGGTSILGGALEIGADAALGTGAVLVNGGTIRYAAAFNDLRAFTIGAAGATLDTQAFNVSYGADLAGDVRLVKSGAKGTLALAGNNTHTGGLEVTAGFVSIDSDARLGAVPGATTANQINLNLGGLHASQTFTLNANRGVALGNIGGGSGTIGVAAGKTLTYGGVLANAGTESTALYKLGAGTLTLSGDNTYTGNTEIYQGKVVLDFRTAAVNSDIINGATTNNLRLLSGRLEVIGKSTGMVSQTFGATTTMAGGHVNIKADSNGGSGTSIALNAIARTAGTTAAPTVNFDLPAAGTITTTTTTAINGVMTAAAANGVAYMTVNNTDWASLSGNNIVALTAYQTNTTDTAWAATDNVALTANATGVTSRSINTLKLAGGADVALGDGQVLTLTTGGILVTGTGASSISGGTIRGSNGVSGQRELVIFQDNTGNPFTIGSVIANNAGATATNLTKTGDGELVLTGTNTFSGGVRINAGVLSISAAENLGTSVVTTASFLIIDGGTLRYTGSGGTVGRNVTLGYNGATIDASGTGALVFGSGSSNTTFSGTYARTLTLTGTNTGDNVYTNSIYDANNGATTLVKNGSGTWVLTPGTSATRNNQFTGGIFISEGTLELGRNGGINNQQGNIVTFADNAPANTRLALNGFSTPVAGLVSASVHAIVENGGDADSVLTIANGTPGTFAGTLRDGAGTGKLAVVKSGAGRQTLSGSGTYTGGTTVQQGTLAITGANTGGGSVNIAKDATLDVSGTLVLGGATKVDGTLTGTGEVSFAPGTSVSGSGTLAYAMTVGGGAGQLQTIAPGNSPGEMTTGSQTWAGGGSYLWEINDTDAGIGLGWDHLQINGTLSLTADQASPFTITVASLTTENLAGIVADLNVQTYSWIIATASGGITGFDASDFVIDTSGFANEPGGAFSVSQQGNSVALNYTSTVPEPATATLSATAGVWLFGCRRRRKK